MRSRYYIFLLLAFCEFAFADTLLTRPQAAMMLLTKALEHYAEANAGQFAKVGMDVPSGPFLQQPSTVETSPNYRLRKYADENFQDPEKPTGEEIEKMKQVLAERYRDKQSAPPSPTVIQTTSMSRPSPPRPSVSATPTTIVTARENLPLPSVSIITVVVIVGVIVFYLRRKSS